VQKGIKIFPRKKFHTGHLFTSLRSILPLKSDERVVRSNKNFSSSGYMKRTKREE